MASSTQKSMLWHWHGFLHIFIFRNLNFLNKVMIIKTNISPLGRMWPCRFWLSCLDSLIFPKTFKYICLYNIFTLSMSGGYSRHVACALSSIFMLLLLLLFIISHSYRWIIGWSSKITGTILFSIWILVMFWLLT